ncbi:MAG: hypothetical protein QXT27_01935 [Pyrobaculum sp.]
MIRLPTFGTILIIIILLIFFGNIIVQTISSTSTSIINTKPPQQPRDPWAASTGQYVEAVSGFLSSLMTNTTAIWILLVVSLLVEAFIAAKLRD